jgi:hypothetical protein
LVYAQDRRNQKPIQASINEMTAKLAPDGPMQETGQVFCSLLSLINKAEADKVVMLAKIDLSNGFWCMLV